MPGIVAVETSPALTHELRVSGRLAHESIAHRSTPRTWLAQLRFFPWAGNSLLFVPILLRNQGAGRAISAMVCFAAYCLAATSAWLIADLMDLPASRLSPRSKQAPLSRGDLSIASSAMAATALAAAALLLPAVVGWKLLPLVALYLAGMAVGQLLLRHRSRAGIPVVCCAFALPPIAGSIIASLIER